MGTANVLKVETFILWLPIGYNIMALKESCSTCIAPYSHPNYVVKYNIMANMRARVTVLAIFFRSADREYPNS